MRQILIANFEIAATSEVAVQNDDAIHAGVVGGLTRESVAKLPAFAKIEGSESPRISQPG